MATFISKTDDLSPILVLKDLTWQDEMCFFLLTFAPNFTGKKFKILRKKSALVNFYFDLIEVEWK